MFVTNRRVPPTHITIQYTYYIRLVVLKADESHLLRRSRRFILKIVNAKTSKINQLISRSFVHGVLRQIIGRYDLKFDTRETLITNTTYVPWSRVCHGFLRTFKRRFPRRASPYYFTYFRHNEEKARPPFDSLSDRDPGTVVERRKRPIGCRWFRQTIKCTTFRVSRFVRTTDAIYSKRRGRLPFSFGRTRSWKLKNLNLFLTIVRRGSHTNAL